MRRTRAIAAGHSHKDARGGHHPHVLYDDDGSYSLSPRGRKAQKRIRTRSLRRTERALILDGFDHPEPILDGLGAYMTNEERSDYEWKQDYDHYFDMCDYYDDFLAPRLVVERYTIKRQRVVRTINDQPIITWRTEYDYRRPQYT